MRYETVGGGVECWPENYLQLYFPPPFFPTRSTKNTLSPCDLHPVSLSSFCVFSWFFPHFRRRYFLINKKSGFCSFLHLLGEGEAGEMKCCIQVDSTIKKFKGNSKTKKVWAYTFLVCTEFFQRRF